MNVVTLQLPEDIAAALLRSLNSATVAPQVPVGALPPTPIAQPAAQPAAPVPKSELEMIIAGIEYTPAQAGFPTNVWPIMVIPQPKGITGNGEGTPYQWIATSSKGGGYYTLRGPLEKPMPTDPKATYDPYHGIGLLAALSGVVTDPDKRSRLYAKVFSEAGSSTKGTVYLENAVQADPVWRGALAQLARGLSPEEALAIVAGDHPLFSVEQLRAAKATLDAA